MNKKRISVILIAIAFILVVLLSCFGLLSIKKIEVTYAVSENSLDAERIQGKLDQYLNDNLLFLDIDEINNVLKDEYYLQVNSIYKNFPNKLSVNINERREVYSLSDGLKTYILDENGFILNDSGELRQGNSVIDLEFITFRNNPLLTSKIEILQANLGQRLVTDNDEIFYKTLEIAKVVGLTDCIKTISIEYCSGDEYDVNFETHTGVKICVVNVMEDGQRKGTIGFEIYDQKASDYQKRFGLIEIKYNLLDSKLLVQHTYDDIDAVDRNDVLLHEEEI